MRPLVAASLGVGLLSLLRLYLIGSIGLGDDEAYYWHWSMRPDWSYFDHPPLVAWLIAGSRALFGDNPFAVRLPFLLCGLATGAVLTRVSWELYGEKAAAIALLSVHLPPMFGIITVFAAPDAPMLLCVAVAARALLHGRWGVVGLALGMGMLAKYPAALVLLGAFGFAVVGRQRGFLLAALLALLLFTPILAWNLAHDLVSFGFHLGGRPGDGIHPFLGLIQFAGGQLLYLGPFVLPLAIGLHRGPSLFRWLALPTLLVFLVASLFTRALPHWAAATWLLAIIPASAWLSLRPRWTAITLGLSAALTGVVYLQAATGILPITPTTADPTNELVGWNEAGAEILRLQVGMPDPEHSFVAGSMYQLSAQAAFATRDQPLEITRIGGRPDQYDLWRPAHGHEGWDAIIVAHDKYLRDPSRSGHFARCEQQDSLPIHRRGRLVRRFSFWRCFDFRGARSEEPRGG